MGIYTTNTHSSIGAYDVAALEGYSATTGCTMALIETTQNDLAIFNGAIMSDMQEIASVNEGYEVINESAKDIWNKIKEMFVKLWAKIKGIFKAFIAKMTGMLAPNKDLYNKYKTVIGKNTNWKDFKVKNFRKFKGSNFSEIQDLGDYNFYDNYGSNSKMFNKDKILKDSNAYDTDDITDMIIKKSLKSGLSNVSSDLSDLETEYMDNLFEDKETVDEWTSGEVLHGCVGDVLLQGDKLVKDVKSANDKMEKLIAKIISNLDKVSGKITGSLAKNRIKSGSDEYKFQYVTVNHADKNSSIKDTEANPSEDFEKMMQFWQKYATQEQSVITKLTAVRLKAMKFLVSQARRVWSSAAAYSSVEHKNEGYEFYTAVGEAAEYDFYTDFDAPTLV